MGYLRPLVLRLLSDREMNGMEMIEEIYERTAGLFDPSPGSVYPLLNKMLMEGLVEVSSEEEGRKIYRSTEKGIRMLMFYRERGHWIWRVLEDERTPWFTISLEGIRHSARELDAVLREISKVGQNVSEETLKTIADLLSKTAKNIREILKEDIKE